MRRSVIKFLLCATFLVGAIAILTAPKANAAKVKVKKVKVNAPYAKKAYIAKGKSVKFVCSVSVSPNKKANKKVLFTSKNKKIATVNKKGVVKAKKVGKTKIIITSKKNKKKKTTVTVNVVKNPVKKVALNKKKASLYTGSTVRLKAKVSAKKGASKKVYWTSSKRSVATVSQKGIVKAKKAGTATITVRAIDGSKKKATCKITVSAKQKNNSVNIDKRTTPRELIKITEFQMYNDFSLHFTINKAKPLSMQDIVLEKRDTTSEAYNEKLDIEHLYTDDQKNYIVEIDQTTSSYQEGDFLRLSLKGHSEVIGEVLYMEPLGEYSSTNIRSFSVGTSISNYSIGYNRVRGYSKYNVSGLPADFTYEKSTKDVKISGTFTQTGTYKIIFQGESEEGSKFTTTTYFLVGSETSIQAAAMPTYGMATPSKGANISATITVAGGSRRYTYSLGTENYGLSIDENGRITGTIATAGTYEIPVFITDANNPELTTQTTLVCYVEEGKTISGKIVDAEGNAMSGYINYNWRTNAGLLGFGSYQVDTSGNYSITVPKNNYAIWANDYYYEFRTAPQYYYIANDMTSLNFVLPVYRVNITEGPDVAYWYNAQGNVVGQDRFLYAKPGTYTLQTKAKENDFLSPTIYEIHFTVTNKSIHVKAAKKELPSNIKPISIGSTQISIEKDCYTMTSFTPSETATYLIYSGGSENTYAILYDSEANQLAYDNDSGNNQNFQITYELEAGKTYYIGTKKYSNKSANASVTISIQKA